MSSFTNNGRISDLLSYLRTPKVQAYVADQIEESLLEVSAFEKLHLLADREFAVEHFMYVDDAHGVRILCKRVGELEEATFYFTGVVSQKSVMPYHNFRDFTQGVAWAPAGHQYVVLTMPGLEHLQLVKRAVSNLHVMARLRLTEGDMKPLTDLIIDGEDAICASAPIGTPIAHTVPTDTPITLTQEQDPQGVVAQYLHQRSLMFLEDNQVDVYLATHLDKAGVYELHGGVSGALLRAGQVVRVEVGFRMVPAGKQATLRMDLKSITIINDDIVAAMAFAEADAESGRLRRKITVSSAGPSALVVNDKPKVKRAARTPKNLFKDNKEDGMMGALPFPPT